MTNKGCHFGARSGGPPFGTVPNINTPLCGHQDRETDNQDMLKQRYVVVDLNAIEEGLNHYIRDDDRVVLPHMIISDLAGIKEYKRISKHTNCLPGWLRARGNQVWLARDWATLGESESSPDIHIDELGWRDDEGSKALRLGKDAPSKQWLESFRRCFKSLN